MQPLKYDICRNDRRKGNFYMKIDNFTSITKKLTAISLAALSGAMILTAPMTSTTFDNYCITAEASSDKYTSDTLVLSSGQAAYASAYGKSWLSKNGKYKLVLQRNGDLVINNVSTGKTIWKTNSGMANNYTSYSFRLNMQGDGNLVIYRQDLNSKKTNATWNSKTVIGGTGNTYSVRLSNDGELYVYHDQKNSTIWSSRSEIECTASKNTFLRASQCLTSPNRNYRAIMQHDGNFVIYERKNGKETAVWNTRTSGNAGAFLALQQDGNLVVYSKASKPLYNSKTSRKPFADYKLKLGDDGVLQLIKKSNNSVIWRSHTPAGNNGTAGTLSNINWQHLKQVGRQPSGSSSCSCYALAYARTILDKTPHTWYTYNLYGNRQDRVCANWPAGNFSVKTKTTKLAGYQLMYDEIKAGRPAIILVQTTNGKRSPHHYVTVIGVSSSANRNNLSPKDFTIIDPAAYDGSAAPTAENMGTVGYDLKWETTAPYIGYNIVTQK